MELDLNHKDKVGVCMSGSLSGPAAEGATNLAKTFTMQTKE